MITLNRMGRRKLGRVPRNITLPEDLAIKADDLATHEGRALSHLVESFLAPYVAANWKPSMKKTRKPKRAKGAK